MNLLKYREVLADVSVRNLILFSFFGRLPHAGAAIALTLHITQTLNKNFASAGIAAMAFTVAVGISGPWRGRHIDRYGLRKALLPSVIVEIIVWPLLGLVPFYAFVPLIFIGGLFSLPIFTVVRQCLAVMVPEAQRRVAFTLDSIIVEFLYMVAPPISILIATQISSQLALIVIGWSSALAGSALMFMNPPTRSKKEAVIQENTSSSFSAQTWKERYVWIQPAFIGVLLSSFVAGMVLNGTDISIISHLEYAQGHNQVDMAWLVFIFWCGASIIGGLIYGAIHRPISPLWLALGLSILTVLCAAATTPLVLGLLSIPTGLMCAPTLTAAAEATAAAVEEDKRGEAMGWNGSALTMGASIGAPFAGIFIDHFGSGAGFTSVALLGTLLCIGALSFMFLIRKPSFSK